MAEDINRVIIVGRLTKDSELMYTNTGYPICKFSIAVNRRRKQGEEWIDEANFFDVSLWGKRGESLNQYLAKGQQIACEGQLKQERWEQDGVKRSKVIIEANNIQLIGSKPEGSGNTGSYQGNQQVGNHYDPNQYQGQQNNGYQAPPQNQRSQSPSNYRDASQNNGEYQAPQQQHKLSQNNGYQQPPVQNQSQQSMPLEQYKPPQGPPEDYWSKDIPF